MHSIITERNIILIVLGMLFMNFRAYGAEAKKISIDPNKQKVTYEFVYNGCFTHPGFNVVLVDGVKMMIIPNEEDTFKLQQELNNAKANGNIVDIDTLAEEKSYGSYSTFGDPNFCKGKVHEVQSISSRSKDQEKIELKAKLALCRESAAQVATNINSAMYSADSLAGNMSSIVNNSATLEQ